MAPPGQQPCWPSCYRNPARAAQDASVIRVTNSRATSRWRCAGDGGAAVAILRSCDLPALTLAFAAHKQLRVRAAANASIAIG